MGWERLRNQAERALRGRAVPIFYHADYRLPLGGLEGQIGLEPRRADFVAWTLLELGAARRADLREPERVRYSDLCRVHTAAWLERLSTPEGLASVFGVHPGELCVDEVIRTVRLGCGGTIGAAREALAEGGPALNLLGGFHHAGPDRGGGLCPVNDIAVAVAALREEGFAGQVCVIDLDAHPPDGTAACLAGDAAAWVGSLSGSDWGPLPAGVDETVLTGAGDADYLAALDGLLGRMPAPDLAFVLAGGDVLAGDRLGALALTLAGARARDLAVAAALGDRPSVWLPGGGYHRDAWRVFAGTGLALTLGTARPLPPGLDPLGSAMGRVFQSLTRRDVGGEEPWLTEADLGAELGFPPPRNRRLLDYYTAEGLELALSRYGVLPQLRRLGYGDFRVALDRSDIGERMQLFARAREEPGGPELLLVESVMERRQIQVNGENHTFLYVHWLNLRHPRAAFTAERPALPGQEEPGLGMAREAGHLLARMAERLGLAGVALRPAWYHVAYASRYDFRFVDPARQGRFEALVRDLGDLPLLAATRAVAEERVLMNGEIYQWEADPMVLWLQPRPEDRAAVEAEAARCRFSLRSE